jgi:hypothetical protein
MAYALLEVEARLTYSTAKLDVKDHSMTGDRRDDRYLLRAASIRTVSAEDDKVQESFSVDTQRYHGYFDWS